jgi:hypothetical protein
MATAIAIEMRSFHREDPYMDDDDDDDEISDSDSSTLRSLKTTIQEYNSILRGLDFLPKPPSLQDDVDSQDEEFLTLDDTSKLREELFAVDHPQMQIQLQHNHRLYEQERPFSDDACWIFLQQWIPWWQPRDWCDPFGEELHYLFFVGIDA